jgi:hypothetical protein
MLICFHKPQPAYLMRKLLLVTIVSAIAQIAFSQSVVKGKVSDTLEKRNLQNAVVSILKRSDSTLVQFTRSAKSGEFQINNIDTGKYVLLVTYPGFADFADYVDVKQAETNLGSISLTLKSKLLDAVVIRSAGAIRIKGDTTEFVADSFNVKEGATVEDLLKKFPGFSVNSKGEVTAQGKRVDKVLVDGEEFFGDDPTMVTQNLSSKAVDKVQMYDTKTEEQNLTGISSSESNTKTLNIKLKSDYKKGSFGRLEGASDFNRYHDAKALYNHFKGVQKFSLYGTKSTTSTGSLSWQDRNKLGVDNNEYQEVEGGVMFISGGNDEFSDWTLKGLPNAYTLGSVYINKWNQDKQTINGSMRYNYLSTLNGSSTFSKTILPNDSVQISQRTSNGRGTIQQYAPTLKYDWKIDSLTTITFKSINSYKTNKLSNYTASETDLEDMTPLNKSNRENNNDGTKRKSDNLLTYKKTFKKPGEQVTASLRYTYADANEDNFTKSEIYNYNNGLLTSTDSINQEKKIHSVSNTVAGNVSWTKPLTKEWNLITLASYSKNTSDGHLNTYDESNGSYKDFSPLYSNNFKYDASALGGTALIRYTTKKINFSVGSGISNLKQQVYNIDSNKHSNYKFLKILPQAQFRYTIRPQTGFSFGYYGSSQQPNIDQLQPLRNNNDPLNVYVGNPNLKVGFNNRFNLNYYTFKTLSQRYFYTYANYTITSNAVTTSSTIDASGHRVSTNVNTNGNSNWYLGGFWEKSGQGKWNPNYGFNANGGTSITFVNGKKSINHYSGYSLTFRESKYKENKYDINIGPQFGQNFSSSSLQPNNKTHYIYWGGNVDGTVYFLKKFEFNSDLDARLRQKINAADRNTNVLLWNARLSRKILKKDVGKISFIAHDILDQNKGVNTITNSNFISNESYLKVPRYFQLKFEWTFNNNPGSK